MIGRYVWKMIVISNSTSSKHKLQCNNISREPINQVHSVTIKERQLDTTQYLILSLSAF